MFAIKVINETGYSMLGCESYRVIDAPIDTTSPRVEKGIVICNKNGAAIINEPWGYEDFIAINYVAYVMNHDGKTIEVIHGNGNGSNVGSCSK